MYLSYFQVLHYNHEERNWLRIGRLEKGCSNHAIVEANLAAFCPAVGNLNLIKKETKSQESHHHHNHQSFIFPVDCKVGDWKPWGKCSVTCGGGTKKRGREVIREAKNAGASCPDLEETEECNTEECPGTLSILLFSFSSSYLY